MSRSDWTERQYSRAVATGRNESQGTGNWLRGREDYLPSYNYFLELIEAGPQKVADRTGRPVVATMCLSAPLELFEAHGLQPLRLTGGHQASERLAAPNLPPVMCPMLRSTLGSVMLAQGSGDSGSQYAGYILPTTCDWVSRFKDLMALEGVNLGSAHHLSTPRIKNRHQALEAWHREVWSLGVYLSELSGRRAGRKELKKAVALYRQAYVALSDLLELKRTGRLSQAWLAVILGSFNFDRVEVWTKKTFELAEAVDKISFQSKGEPIFLAGSPMIFPNFKVIRFLEEAGLRVVMDDLCSSERILPGPVHLGDDSLDSIMEALAQRYFLGCLCPTFTDDDRRINNILSPDHQKLYRGVIFHVLKGCHLFDLESLALEGRIKAAGLRFLKIETDHSQEDGPTLLTRLEAYRETLKEVNETSVRN